MAEIKSAIELAMEKTRGLVMDDKEKTSLAGRELRDRIRAVYRRYLSGLTDDDGARAQLDEVPCDEALKRKIVLDLLNDELDISGETPGMSPLIRFIGFIVDEKLQRQLQAFEKEYLKELEKLKIGISSHIAEELASAGISGDSVEPGVEAWPKWQEASGEVRKAFREQVLEWKEKLTAIT